MGALRSSAIAFSAVMLTACHSGAPSATPKAPGANPAFAPARTTVNWPQFRFDDHRTGVNPFEMTITKTNAPRLQLAWRAQLGGLVVSSSPAVVNGIVYIGSSDGRLWAYPAAGCKNPLCTKPLWSSVSLGQIVDSPTVANGVVYIGSQTSFSSNDGKLNAFSAQGCGGQACSPLWQGLAGTDAILQSSPAVAAGQVLVGAHDRRLYAFDAGGCGASTCPPIWTATTGGSIESTPTIADKILYVGSDDGKLYGFKARGCGAPSCAPLWTGTLGSAPFDSSPAISDGIVYIGAQHGVAAFKASGCGKAVCKPLWQAANNTDFFNGSPAVHKNRIYIGVENGLDVYAASGCGQPTCQPLWVDFGPGQQAAVLSSPTIAHGVVFAGRNTGEVLAWREGSCGQSICTSIWSGRTNDPIVSSSPTVVNGRVYIGSSDDSFPSDITGRLYVFAVGQQRASTH